MQLEMGISTRRYLPASGTAGLARSLVSGNRRVPCPPPMMTESTLLVLVDWRPLCVNCDIEVPRQRTTTRVIRWGAAAGKLWEIRSAKCEGRQRQPSPRPSPIRPVLRSFRAKDGWERGNVLTRETISPCVIATIAATPLPLPSDGRGLG